MAINACTIIGSTLNGRGCSNKFAALVPILHPTPAPTTSGTNPRVLRDLHPPRPFEIEDNQIFTFEQPIVSVSAEFMGLVGVDSQEVSGNNLDFVTVTGFKIDDEAHDLITINISDLNFG